ncbi:hypothetical protein ACI3EY_16730 [Ornithinimicrobium sp. LYQ92]|uniref:hypothetical protein n=1 Tax=Serinicoccus sp. LYQ92 TaxID=3378798 RepID=UPI003852AC67
MNFLRATLTALVDRLIERRAMNHPYFVAEDQFGQLAIWVDQGTRATPLWWRASGTPSQVERRALFDHLTATMPRRDRQENA